MKKRFFIFHFLFVPSSKGNVLVVDMGRLKIWSDLQLGSLCIEDATQLELEEKLYDRFYFDLTNFQILIFSHGKRVKSIEICYLI